MLYGLSSSSFRGAWCCGDDQNTVFADVVLPVGLVTGESSGTMMTLDRRCQRLERAADPPGGAREAGPLIDGLAEAILSEEDASGFSSASSDEWERWRELSGGTAFDSSGISAVRLGRELDVAWPCASPEAPGTVRLDATIVSVPPNVSPARTPAPLPAPTPERPFLLLTGPLREHARSRLRTGRTPELHYDAPTPRLEMHPNDGPALGLTDGDWAAVSSESGTATARLWLTDRVLPGTVFLPEHFGFLSDAQGGNSTQKEPEGLAHLLTSSAIAPDGESPAGLVVPVSIRKARRRDMRRTGL